MVSQGLYKDKELRKALEKLQETYLHWEEMFTRGSKRNETQMFRQFIDQLIGQRSFRFKMSAPAMQNVFFSLK